MSDGDSDDSDTEGIGLSTAMFISGPSGAGKTAIVYACAEELGYKVVSLVTGIDKSIDLHPASRVLLSLTWVWRSQERLCVKGVRSLFEKRSSQL